jgi:hypothetical protein
MHHPRIGAGGRPGASQGEVGAGAGLRLRAGRAGGRRARGAPDRASPNFMGLASLGLEIGIFCDFLYSVLLLNALGLDVLGLARS